MKNNLRLLLIDDDADDRRLFIEAAKEIDSNIECMTANDGQQGLELLRDNTRLLPDYIFLDLRMPRVNGRKFLAEIKSDERCKNIPVIIYTTSRELSESTELKDLGAVHFTSKPTNPDEIYYLISFVLEEQWNGQQNTDL